LEQQLKTSVGLRTLNRQVLEQGQADRYCKSWKEGEAPPVVRVDGIWLTIMSKTEEVRRDRCGRQRPVKVAKRIPILVAQGVWPESGKTEIIAWMLAKGEDEMSWQTFLETLYDNGLTPENGLKLLVSDGGTGFLAAYQRVYWMVPRQRCIFHKLTEHEILTIKIISITISIVQFFCGSRFTLSKAPKISVGLKRILRALNFKHLFIKFTQNFKKDYVFRPLN
jgi:hypothetical protein